MVPTLALSFQALLARYLLIINSVPPRALGGVRLQRPLLEGARIILGRSKSDQVSKVPNACSQRGASLVEYALLVALVAVAAIGGVTLLGTNSSSQFSNVANLVISSN